MSPVGGSRHYDGGGLGAEGGWGCPSCGADNAGPLAQGCAACGAGRPGRYVGNVPPAPPPPEPRPPAAAGEATADEAQQLGEFARWARGHQDATLEQAYTAGYIEGMKAGMRVNRPPVPATSEPIAFSPDHIINRTMVAALSLFRDQVLAGDPEETRNGEWLTSHQVSALIHQISQHIETEEPTHA